MTGLNSDVKEAFRVPYGGSEAIVYLLLHGRRPAIRVDLPHPEPQRPLLDSGQKEYRFLNGNLPPVHIAEFYEGGVLTGLRIEPRSAVRRDQQWPLEPQHISEILRANYNEQTVPPYWFV